MLDDQASQLAASSLLWILNRCFTFNRVTVLRFQIFYGCFTLLMCYFINWTRVKLIIWNLNFLKQSHNCRLRLKHFQAKTEFLMFIVSHVWNELTLRPLSISITRLKGHRLQDIYTWFTDYEIKYRNWFTAEQSVTLIAKHILEENVTLGLHTRSMYLQTEDSFSKSNPSWIKMHQPIISWAGTNGPSSNPEVFPFDMLAPERKTPWSEKIYGEILKNCPSFEKLVMKNK